MTTGTPIGVSPKTVHIGVGPASVDVEPWDTLQFTNDSTKYPRFEVVFLGSSPNNSDLTFEGTSEIAVPVTIDGEFEYFVRHYPKHGKPLHTGVFSVRSCTGGCH